MEIALQYLINGLMLGIMYGLVAVGFTLFFGVLDVIKFSHGDVLTVGVFTGFATYLALEGGAGRARRWCSSSSLSIVAMAAMAVLGAVIARYLVLPLRVGAGAQHPADHADAGHGAARRRAAGLSRRLEPEAVPGAAADDGLSPSAISRCGWTA